MTLNHPARVVFECAVPSVDAALAAAAELDHPCQVVVQTRQPAIDDAMSPSERLRASLARLRSELSDGGRAAVRRLLVVVSAASEGSHGEAERRLRGADVEPLRLRGRALDALGDADVVHERCSEVLTVRGMARTLIVTHSAERLRPELLDTLPVDHDLSFHLTPRRSCGLVELSAYLTLWTANPDALDAADDRAQALLAAHGIRVRRPYLQAEPALVSGLPLGIDPAACFRALPVDAIRSQSPKEDGRALLYGVDPGTRRPITLDRFSLGSPDAVVLGEAGPCSRWLTLEIVRARLAGRSVHVVDTKGAHRSAVLALDGRVIAPTGFDPLAGSLESRLPMMTALIELIGGGLPPAARSAVEDAVGFAYAARGHACGAESDDGLTPPTLDEIAVALERRADCAELAPGLRERGSHLIGRRPTPLPAGPFTIHDLTALPEAERPLAALLSIDRLCREVPRDCPALLTVDGGEGGLVLGTPGALPGSLTPGRRLGLTLAGDAEALLGGPLRQFALSAGLVVVLRQPPAAVQALAEALRLTPAEQSWLLRAAPDEGLLIADGRRLAFHSIASDEETRLTTGGTP